jgi:hypothetical protein
MIIRAVFYSNNGTLVKKLVHKKILAERRKIASKIGKKWNKRE